MTSEDIVPKPALLFTDIEGSTKLVERDEAAYRSALQVHHGVLRRIAVEYAGKEFFDTGDGLCIAFPDPVAALRAAALMQEGLSDVRWPREIENLRVRMAVHWAEAEFHEGQYRGPAMHFTARLLGAANGGQVICSEAVAREVGEQLIIQRLGTYRLRGFSGTVAVYQYGDITFSPLRAAQARRHNLPQATDAFVGRTSEIATLVELLSPTSPTRLVTLIGAGGLGKSRLSLATAEHLLDAYDHSVLHVPAVTIADADGLVEALVKALGSKPEGDSWSQLLEALEETPTLLIFDNLEHMVTEGAVAIGRILRDLPLCHVLVTSRIRLGVVGESEFAVPPLGLPRDGDVGVADIESSEAVCLFVERVASVRSEFTLSPENSAKVAAICRSLEGIPLALELAAARSRVLSIAELEVSLAELPLAADGPLGAALRWSVDMLPSEIRGFLGSLSIFRGGWTALTAGEVAAISSASLCLSYLHYLLSCSLVQAAEANNSMRFSMLEPVRQMLELQFKPEVYQEMVARHGAFFIALGRRVNVEFGTPGEEKLIQEIEPEVSNILAALEREPSDEHRLSSSVHFHMYAMEGSCNRALRKILAKHPADTSGVRVSVMARVWTAIGALDHVLNLLESAAEAYRKAVVLFEECKENAGATAVRFNLAIIAKNSGDYETARVIYGKTADFFRENEDFESLSVVLDNFSLMELETGNLDVAEQLQRESMAIAKEKGFSKQLADNFLGLARVHLKASQPAKAMEYLSKALDLNLRLLRERSLWAPLLFLAQASMALGFRDQGIIFATASRKAVFRSGIQLSRNEETDFLNLFTQLQEGVGQERFDLLRLAGEKSGPVDWLAEVKKITEKLQFDDRTA